jgi:hypothetical protein
MVAINYGFREISCKIVYYGPGLSGKTTNLQYVHDRVPAKSRGELISLATEADRTLYFDFLPINVGDIGGFATKFQLYTVPGQVFYNATRKLVLRGVDGIVFVADSQLSKMDENIESLANMHENLRENDVDPTQIPIVMQYNKRDLPDIASIEELERTLNPEGWPFTEASAVEGIGVFDTMKRITKLVLEDTKRRTSGAAGPIIPPAKHPGSVFPGVAERAPVRLERSSPETVPTGATAVATAPEPATPAPMSGPGRTEAAGGEARREPVPGMRSIPPPSGPRPAGTTIIAAQRSTRIRRRQRSLFDRLFGWLFGR